MNIKYFKVMRGFNQDDYIPITESELKKAIYAHITGTNVAFEMGSITGTHISAVVPDFHRTLGWNPSHKLDSDDWNDIRGRGLENTMRNLIAEAKQTVQDVIASGDKRLLSDEQRKLN
jgi:hypothetical protein